MNSNSFDDLKDLRIKLLNAVYDHLSEPGECTHSLAQILNFQNREEKSEENGWKVSEANPTTVLNHGSSSLDRVRDRQEDPTPRQI